MAMMRPSSLNEMHEAKTVIIQKNANGFYQWDSGGNICCLLAVYKGGMINSPDAELKELAEERKILRRYVDYFGWAIDRLDNHHGKESDLRAIEKLASILGLNILREVL